MNPNLSIYFPQDTTYFYGYPSGEDSGFYNEVPGQIEQLVSARPLVCAGPDMRIVSFAQASRDDMLDLLEETGVQVIDRSRILRLPEDITEFQGPLVRNERTVDSLVNIVPDATLVMAQPFARDKLESKYRLPQELCTDLNDKWSMQYLFPPAMMPRTIAQFVDGEQFLWSEFDDLPCVVKVASSSSGDGVRVCKTPKQLLRAKRGLRNVAGLILVQEYIEASENLGVQFGIPADAAKPIDVIGMSRQLVSENGEFIGGVVLQNDSVPGDLAATLQSDVLPRIRACGWYGVGGLDVLKTAQGRYCVIDPNIRMTAMTAPVYASVSGSEKRNMLAMNVAFNGADADLIRLAQCGTADQLFRLIAVRRNSQGGIDCNGALLFDQPETLRENARRAEAEGFFKQEISDLASGTLSIPTRAV